MAQTKSGLTTPHVDLTFHRIWKTSLQTSLHPPLPPFDFAGECYKRRLKANKIVSGSNVFRPFQGKMLNSPAVSPLKTPCLKRGTEGGSIRGTEGGSIRGTGGGSIRGTEGGYR